MDDPVYVTRPHLPDLADLMPILEEIWGSRLLTNHGPVLRRFESALCDYLGVDHIALTANATLATVLAMQQAGITSGEVITTPFTFVATAHAIKLAGATPVFADIDPVTLNLDPQSVAEKITPQTKAILPVHIFGRPCDVDGLAAVADAHGLRLIYDAAHAFGVRHAGQSVLQYGDAAILSFHATKVLNTFEGGAVILHDAQTKEEIDRLTNFAFTDANHVSAVGMNAKMHEFGAAVGLAQLCEIDDVLKARANVAARYAERLQGVAGLDLVCPPQLEGHNHYAFPIRIGPDFGKSRDALFDHLAAHNIITRRYFHPLVSAMSPYRDLPSSAPGQLPVAQQASEEILSLPLYPDLAPDTQDRIIDVVLS